jgi:hypothetical protein
MSVIAPAFSRASAVLMSKFSYLSLPKEKAEEIETDRGRPSGRAAIRKAAPVMKLARIIWKLSAEIKLSSVLIMILKAKKTLRMITMSRASL